MKRISFIGLLLIVLSSFSYAQEQSEISVKDISSIISRLASDQFQGRKPGTSGDSLASGFIAEKFRNAGLQMLFNNGYQEVSLITGYKLGADNALSVNNEIFEPGIDFEPVSFSANTAFKGNLTIAGYGLTINSDSLKWDDYSGENMENQWVMFMEGVPPSMQQNEMVKKQSNLRSKVLNALDHKAKGVLIVNPNDTVSTVSKTIIYDKNSSGYEIPVFIISVKTAGRIFANLPQKLSLKDFVNEIKLKGKPSLIKTNLLIAGKASVIPQQIKTKNIVGSVPGNDPILKDQFIIVGAHYDHLGWGGEMSGSRRPDTAAVHFGADDNASGVAAVIELAEKLAKEKSNKRTVVFVAFGAEEFGLIGSRAFVAASPVDLKSVNLMLNFDMIGRLDSLNHLTVGGVGTSSESKLMIESLNKDFELSISEGGYGPSDHASFYSENIPVLYFTTGVHDQYHTPFDTFSKINLPGEKKIIEYAWTILEESSNQDQRLTFKESGPKTGASGRTELKVTLGIMPDFAGVEKRGLRIDGVTPGKAGANHGLKKGDVIVAIDGKKVGNIYDYMNRMKEYSSGQIISVDILRDEKPQIIIITL